MSFDQIFIKRDCDKTCITFFKKFKKLKLKLKLLSIKKL